MLRHSVPLCQHRHALCTAPSQDTPSLLGGDRLVVRFTVGPTSDTRVVMLCTRFRPKHHSGQWSVVGQESQAAWCKTAIPSTEIYWWFGNPTGAQRLGGQWVDTVSTDFSTVSDLVEEMKCRWGKFDLFKIKLFNHGQMSLFLPLEGKCLRRCGVCFLCRGRTRGKLETLWNFPFH